MKTLVVRFNEIWKNYSLAYVGPRVFLILLLTSSVSFVVRGQTKQWDRTFGGSLSEEFSTIIPTPDGGFLLGGSSTSAAGGNKTQPSKGQGDYWVVKVNASGTKVWDKTIGTSSFDFLADLAVTPDGGYLLAGSTFSDSNGDKTENSKGGFDYWVVKLDVDGNKVWDKTIGGNSSDLLRTLVAAPGGGFLLGGSSFSGKGGDKSQAGRGGIDRDYWVVKIGESGAKLWDRTITGDSDDDLQAIVATPDGGFLVGGNSFSGIGYNKTGEARGIDDYWVVKLTKNGVQVWDSTLGTFGTEDLRSIITTPDGGYLLGGSSDTGINGDKSTASKGNWDYWVVKINKTGAKVWDKTVGSNGEDYFKDLVATPGGGYLLGGNSSSGVSGDKTEKGRGSSDYWIVKISEIGNKLWDLTLGGSGHEEMRALISTSENGYLIGGRSFSGVSGEKTEASRGDYDYWLVNIKEDNPLAAQWNMRYGGAKADGFTVLIATSDGGYLSGGYSNSAAGGDKSQNSQGLNDYWIVKSDKSGKKLWDKRYGGAGDDFLNAVIQTRDGGYLLGGSSLSNIGGDKTQPTRGERDFWIVKIDAQGNKRWDKRYGGTGSDELQLIRQMPSGSYILAGSTNSPASGEVGQGGRGGLDYWVIKINSTGTRTWSRRFGGDKDDNLESLTTTLDGGFLLGGSSASGISGDKTQKSRGNKDYWVVRITGEGDQVWDKRFGGGGEDNLMSMGSTGVTSDNFYIAGHTTSSGGGDKSQDSRGKKDFWMLKLNSDGAKLWDKRFGGSEDEGLRTIFLTTDGGYLLAGRSESGVSSDKTQNNWGSSDYWIVKTNALGQKQWDKRFGSNGYEEIRAALQTSDGGFLLGGRTYSGIGGDKTQSSQGDMDYWLVKVAPETRGIPRVAERELTFAEKPAPTAEANLLKAYPNPFQSQITVSFTLPETQLTTVKVYDMQGREITTLFQAEAKANQTYQVEWLAANKPTGIYLLQLQTPTQRQRQKLLLTK